MVKEKPNIFLFDKSTYSMTILFLGVVVAVTTLMTLMFSDIPQNIEVGSIAEFDIRADRDYEIIDEETTNKFRAEALQSILPVYDYSVGKSDDLAGRISLAFSAIRTKGNEFAEKKVAKKEEVTSPLELLTDNDLAELKTRFNETLSITVTDKDWNALKNDRFSRESEKIIISAIQSIMALPIVDHYKTLSEQKEKGIVVLNVGSKNEVLTEESWNSAKIENAISLETAKEKLSELNLVSGSINRETYDSLIAVASKIIQPNLNYNQAASELRKENALKDVKPSIIKIQAGEIIARRGSRLEKTQINVIESIHLQKRSASGPLKVVGQFLLTAIVIGITVLIGRRYIKEFPTRIRDLLFMGLMLVVIIALLRIFLFLSSAIVSAAHFDLDRHVFSYLIPVATGAMLVRFVLSMETAVIFSVILSVIAGLFMIQEPTYAAFCLASSLVGAFSISNADKRSSIIRAGAITGVVNMVIVMSILLLRSDSIELNISANNIFWYAFFAFLGGLGSSLFMMAFTPIAENLFGYTTDIQLLELSNLNHPLLRELVIRAPGTYHHSHLVGVLAEAAASEIGANPLLARVGAYYHDIGKIKKPQYYVENDPNAGKRHDKLSPHMSALIIGSHVKDGLELAKEFKLPKAISRMIPEHHGTKMIGIFYQKAKESTDPEQQKVDEKDFRYPGPKPQSREAAILLLADASEAACRSLKEKSHQKILQQVRTLVNAAFSDGELDESELTLRDLNDITNAFTRILNGIYHQRIEYADFKEMANAQEKSTDTIREHDKQQVT